jgi:DNA-directed RNA polymerase subunit RPC12/RpoP
MAARESVTYGIKCPSCQQEGSVRVTENNHPYMTSTDIKVRSVVGDFDVVEHGDKDVAITCKKCSHHHVM